MWTGYVFFGGGGGKIVGRPPGGGGYHNVELFHVSADAGEGLLLLLVAGDADVARDLPGCTQHHTHIRLLHF
jgi:hypothetical protein